jgi:hypothetical protein
MDGRVRGAIPDFGDRTVVDAHMERLDTQGLSRRQFLSLASAGIAAGAAASALGIPNVAVADPSGKIAYLAWKPHPRSTASTILCSTARSTWPAS